MKAKKSIETVLFPDPLSLSRYNHGMTIDKELYRQAQEWYREWNVAEERERYDNAGKLSPQESWKQYVALWELAMKLSPEQSPRQRQLRLTEWDEYYSRVQGFESRRRWRG
jgi:hypothetical protein